jgi:hypothetical protein
MFDVVFIDVIDAKIVNYQGERNWLCFVMPQASGMCTFVIPKRRKFAAETFVCKDACLWQSPYYLLHFQIDKPLQRMLAKVALSDNPFCGQIKGHFHILEVFQRYHQVEVFYINTHVSGKGSADDAVPMKVGCIQVCCVHICT